MDISFTKIGEPKKFSGGSMCGHVPHVGKHWAR